MTDHIDDTAQENPIPTWVEPFLAELAGCDTLQDAARRSGISASTVYGFKNRHAWFRQRIEAVRGLPATPARRWGESRIARFLEILAETSNVAAAARAAEVSVSQIYQRRRSDPAFARQWYAALAEGYDNLEMELLGRLRAGERADSGDGSGGGSAKEAASRTRFDTATALRCLTAHRDSVAREKGRRALADEVVTIAAINAKIDRLRLAGEAGAKAIAEARRANAARKRKGAGDGR